MLSRSRTVTSLAAVPRHRGIQREARSPMRRSPSSWAIPTSVLANDLVAEYTSCIVSGPVPLKYHSPASLPSRTTTRQFECPCRACAAICASFAASSPTAAGATFSHDVPGAWAAARAGDASTSAISATSAKGSGARPRSGTARAGSDLRGARDLVGIPTGRYRRIPLRWSRGSDGGRDGSCEPVEGTLHSAATLFALLMRAGVIRRASASAATTSGRPDSPARRTLTPV